MKATGAQLWLIRSNYSPEHAQAQLYSKNCVRATQFKEINILRKLAVSRLLPLSYSSISAATLSANDLNSFDTRIGTETRSQNRFMSFRKIYFGFCGSMTFKIRWNRRLTIDGIARAYRGSLTRSERRKRIKIFTTREI